MADVDSQKVMRLAAISPNELGHSEEEVKINFVVPLLEALGHTRLRFEHKQKDVVLRAGSPRRATVVVEAKRAGEPLDRHLPQLERYSAEERSLLSVLTNGEEVRLYAPLWPAAATFADSLLWALRRGDLASPPQVAELGNLLSADALASGGATRAIAARQARIEEARRQVEAMQASAKESRGAAQAQLRELDQKAAPLQAQLASLEEQRAALLAGLAAGEARVAEATSTLLRARGLLPPEATPPAAARPRPPAAARARPPAAESGAPAPPAERPARPGLLWTDEELFGKASECQRRVLAAFVRAGSPTLGTKEIARLAGLTFQQAHGALTRFTHTERCGTKEPFFQVTRPAGKEREPTGVLYTVVEKYWQALLRLYRG